MNKSSGRSPCALRCLYATKCFFLFLIVLLSSLPAKVKAEKTEKPKYIWLDAEANYKRFSNRDTIRYYLDKIKDTGFNTIVVDVKATDGFVHYKRTKHMHDARPRQKWDYLQFFIEEARKRDLKVAVSAMIFPAGRPAKKKGVVYADKRWDGKTAIEYTPAGMKDIRDDSTKVAAFLNPILPEVREYCLGFIKEIVSNYQFDIFVLDYCRYSGVETDFSEASRIDFEKYIGEKVPDFPTDIFTWERDKKGDWYVKDGVYAPLWYEYRAMVIHDFIKEVKGEIKKIRPDMGLDYWAASWHHGLYRQGQNWGGNEYDPYGKYPWASKEYKKTGFASYLSHFMNGAYLSKVYGKSDPESMEYAYAKGREIIGGETIMLGSIYAQAKDIMEDAAYVSLTQTDGLVVFDIVQVIEYDLWDTFKRAIEKAGLKDIGFSGTVRCEGKPVAGVPVTDGIRITVTDKQGHYSLQSSGDTEFIYISTPSGYELLPDNFYLPVTDKSAKKQRFDFALKQLPVDDNKHAFFVWADPQVYVDNDLELVAASVKDMQQLINANYEKLPLHGILCGDIVGDDKSYMPKMKAILETGSVPFFYTPGNHDVDDARTDEGAKKTFKQHFGPDYCSFDRGKIHYVILDDVFCVGRSSATIAYLTEKQLNWLEQDLSRIEPGRTVIVSFHIPTYTREARNKEWSKESNHSALQNRRQLYKILSPYRTHIMSGHTHYNENFVLADSLYEHVHAALCGQFWQGDDCSDGTPQGYAVYEVDGDSISWYYKCRGKDKTCQFRVHPLGTNPEKPDAVTVNVWNYDPAWKVYWYENGIKQGEMIQYKGNDPFTADFYRRNKGAFRYDWLGTAPTGHLFYAVPSSPESKVSVEVIDRFGNRFK